MAGRPRNSPTNALHCSPLIRHHVRVHDVAYLKGQTYLEPHPRELMLRNHV